jgi:hypothetical protein
MRKNPAVNFSGDIFLKDLFRGGCRKYRGGGPSILYGALGRFTGNSRRETAPVFTALSVSVTAGH